MIGLEVLMPCHRVIALLSLTTWFAFAGCEADPGTVNVMPLYVTTTSTTSTGGGGGGDVGTTTSTTSAGGEGGGPVECTCEAGLTCCGPACVNMASDPLNCGACGAQCGAEEACIQGECKDPCDPDFGCEEGLCCGKACCGPGALCCDYGASADAPDLHCQEPVNGTCPLACSGCEG
ncbi:hypothetical protein WMF31_25000 [Sorangium sp. So ce1036]|uniref:hypothetical protein n=1 Tax=Sorangium sp. So ce1036 TaxID=3133328 RepID=UPI003EFBD350